MSKSFIHLHNHMEGSYSDSALPSRAALERARELGMSSFALTDHGEMAMVPKYARICRELDMKPVVGVEAYFVEDAAENIRKRVNQRYHLLLLAENARGLANLYELSSRSWSENCLMQKLGLVDWRLLDAHSEGVICLSGCMAGPVGWSWKEGRTEDADRMYGRLASIFGDRFYLEVFDHDFEMEKLACQGVMEVARRHGVSCVLTNDCHYLEKKDWILHDVLIKTRFGRPTEFELPQHEYYIKSPAEMRALDFPPDFSNRTLEIAKRITLSVEEILAPRASEAPEEAAFLGVRGPIGRERALEKAAGVRKLSRSQQESLKKMSEEKLGVEQPEILEVARKIETIPDAPRADLSRVVVAPALSSRVPLRRTQRVLFTMWDEEDCRAAGARILPIEEYPALAAASTSTRAYLQGLSEYRKRRLEKARIGFEKALEFDPGFTNAKYQLALSDYYRGAKESAVQLFDEILAEEPDFERLPHLFSYRGWCLLELARPDSALADFEASLALKGIPGSLLGKSIALETLGRFQEAREALLGFLEKHPEDSQVPEAHAAMERILEEERRNKS